MMRFVFIESGETSLPKLELNYSFSKFKLIGKINVFNLSKKRCISSEWTAINGLALS
jgi:hypothetical protein